MDLEDLDHLDPLHQADQHRKEQREREGTVRSSTPGPDVDEDEGAAGGGVVGHGVFPWMLAPL